MRKPCKVPACELPKLKGRHFCYWHFLAKQPIEVQERAAQARLAKAEGPHRARVPQAEWPADHRWCAGCQWFVPLFYCQGSRCRACASRASHRSAAATKYLWPPGMTYDRLLARQQGRCAICGCTPRTRRLAIDHDHETGYVRGLLCARCNHELLGAAHDDVRILRAAVYYLTAPPAIAKAPATGG